MEIDPASLDPEERANKFFALASAALGVLSLCGGFIIPAIGAFLGVLGVVLGILGRRSENRKSATVGIALSAIGLLTAIIYSVLLYAAKY